MLVSALLGGCVIVPNCPNRTFDLLAAPVVLAVQCLAVMWATDRAVIAFSARRMERAWAVLVGFALAAMLLGLNVLVFRVVMWS